MDKRKLAKYAIGAGIIGVCAYSGYNMGSEIGYEQGALIPYQYWLFLGSLL